MNLEIGLSATVAENVSEGLEQCSEDLTFVKQAFLYPHRIPPMTKKISDRQIEIIDAAGRILSQSGVTGLTTKNLAREMQFTESAIYRHFGSKEELIVAMLNHLAQLMDVKLEKAAAKEIGPAEKFAEMLDSQFRFFKKNPHYVVAIFSDGIMEESEKISKQILKIMEVRQKHLNAVIKSGQQHGVFTREIDSEDLVHIVMGSFRLQMFKWRASGFTGDIRKKGDKLIQNLLRLIKNKS